MKAIILKNKMYRNKFNRLLLSYASKLDPSYLSLIKIVIIRFKKYSDNEYYILLSLLYALYFFKIIDLDSKILKKRDRKNIKRMIEVYEYTLLWEFEKYTYSTMRLSPDLLLFKEIINYTVLLSEDNYLKIVSHTENYYKSCWYMIPCLTMSESRLLAFFQDIYFKKIYPKEYKITKQWTLWQWTSYEIPWAYHIEVINDLSYLITEAKVIWKIQIRKKTYFSLYNKMKRKNSNTLSDTIWVRIIFDDLPDLYAFIQTFEEKCVYTKKKDYITSPKSNGYQSIHYKYISPYRNEEVQVELQLRTIEMEKWIHNRKEISHFNYTIKENKWAPLFTEVHDWYKYMLEYTKNKKDRL